ncbi:MAG: NUDIX domain-containing protein, partial [Saprospiraceae bacterium]
RRGYWNVPGGFLENGERVEDGAAREVWEEAEARVRILGVHTIFTLTDFHHVYIHFLGELVDGRFGVGEESSESRLFAEEEIPWKDVAFRSSVFTLKKYFEDRRNGEMRAHLGAW